jgi:membrane protein
VREETAIATPESPAKATRLALWREVVRKTASVWFERDAMTQSAALAFFTVFSLVPVLFVVERVAGLPFGHEAVRAQIVRQFGELMGQEQARAIESVLQATVGAGHARGLAGVFGYLTLAFGATAVFVQLQTSLNLMWDVAPKPGPLLGILVRKRLLSFALVIAIGFLLLVSLTLSAAISASELYIQGRLGIPARPLAAANTVFSFLVFTVLFALMFRVLPDVEIPWRDVWFGSVVTSILFSVGKWAIGLYLGRAAIASPYGAAGSLIVILFWVYYTSLLVLFGAAFTRVYSRVFLGSHRDASPGATRVKKVEKKMPKT